MRGRARRIVALAAVVAALAPAGHPAPAVAAEIASGPLADRACSLPHRHLVRMWRGAREGRSGEILIVPKEPNFVNGGLSHNGPWESVQRIPMFLYGPGFIRARGKVARPVDMADVAPTLAELLGFPLEGADGSPLEEALVARWKRPVPPRLILTVVWDGGGRNVLARWPGAWPRLAGLIPQGTWYQNAVDGTSPSVTSPVHATLGTGVFPRRHGLTDSQVRGPDGRVIDSWSLGPRLLLEPTLADLHDAALGGGPLVAAVAVEAWHLGMIGHGTSWEGGDPDLAVLRGRAEGFDWGLPAAQAPYFAFPPYVNEVGGAEEDIRALDLRDGMEDGRWRGHVIRDLDGGFNTPARLPFQTRTVLEILDREGFGADDVPDLFFTNYKDIDGAGHRWGLHTYEMKDTVRATDGQLPELIRFLDQRVGRGRWVLLVTADHGVNPEDPEAFPIAAARLGADLAAAFDDADGVPVVQRIRPTQVYVDVAELRQNGHTLDQVATFLNRYTERDSLPHAASDQGTAERVFAAAFPTRLLPRLECLPEARS